MGAPDFQLRSMMPMAAWYSSRAVLVGAGRGRWRQISLNLGSRMVTWRVDAFMLCFRSRTATWSASMATPRLTSSRRMRLRGKVSPLPTDLGGVYVPAGATGLCSRPLAYSHSCPPCLPKSSVSAFLSKAAKSPMVDTPYCPSTLADARPTKSRSVTGRGQTMRRKFSREMTVVASGFL